MVFGAFIGSLFGGVMGVAGGMQVFPNNAHPKSYSFLHPDSDPDNTIPVPELDAVPLEFADLLEYTSEWTMHPEFDKVQMVNRIVALLWPNYNRAIMQMVRDIVMPIVAQQTQQISVLESVEFKTMDLGTNPIRIGGINHTSTDEDECILEMPIMWGSNCEFEVVLHLRVASVKIIIPIKVKNVQTKAKVRVTFKPLVETIPCLGGVHVSLLGVPHVDFHLSIIKGVDIMALPGVNMIVNMALKMGLGSMFLYPNSLPVDLMGNFGMVPDPKGVLLVKLIKIEGLKNTEMLGTIDPYVKLQVRENRSVRSKTVWNKTNPNFEEEQFYLVVDEPLRQRLYLTVYNDEDGWQDEKLCEGFVWLWEKKEGAEKDPKTKTFRPEDRQEKDFITTLSEKMLTVPLYSRPKGLPMFKAGKKKRAEAEQEDEGKPPRGSKDIGTKAHVAVRFIPFSAGTVDDDADDADEKEKAAAAAAVMRKPTMRIVHHNITNLQKGLLTVTLVRGFNLGDGRDVDPYVVFTLRDPDAAMPDVVQQSTVLFNEPNPQWRESFDFVMVSAGSTLLVNVYDKTTFGENLNPMKIHKMLSKPEDKPIGKLRIPVMDVAKNGRLRDDYFLREVDQGDLELIFKWQSVHIRDDV